MRWASATGVVVVVAVVDSPAVDFNEAAVIYNVAKRVIFNLMKAPTDQSTDHPTEGQNTLL